MAEKIRILIADDHPIVREGLHALIATEPGMEVVATAVDGVDAVLKARRLKPDVILLDLVMPGMGGIEAIRRIKQDNPDARVLVLTSFSDDEQIFSAIRVGALGYLLKDAHPEALFQAIRDTHQGRSALHPAVARKVISGFRPPVESPDRDDILTEREREVLNLMAAGLSNQEIAQTLVLSVATVRSHVSHILAKLGASNRTQAILHALQEGLVSLEGADDEPRRAS